MAAAAAAVAALALAGCPRSEPSPEGELKAFLASIRERRAEDAWARLSAANQQTLEARAREFFASAAGSDRAPTPAETLFGLLDLRALGEPESLIVVSPFSSEVVVRATMAAGRSGDFRLVREGAGWKVDLLASLKPLTPPEPSR